MLGFALHRVLHDVGYDVAGTVRTDRNPASAWCAGLRYETGVDVTDFGRLERAIQRRGATVVINATGVNRGDADVRQLLAINSMFPRRLDAAAVELGVEQFVHFSTDGVFRGTTGGYDESSIPDTIEPYGMSKFLGEPVGTRSLVIRTSLLGRALCGGASLVDWLLRQRGAVRGYRRAIFSGVPVNEVAAALDRILRLPAPLTGVHHLSAAPIAKYEVLELVRRAWHLDDVTIVPDDSVVIDRSLDSRRLRDAIGYQPSPWPEMIARMHAFYEALDAGTKVA
jgi:dTDP-4-dehydrorhamnose reductase